MQDNAGKLCKSCQVVKPLEEFHKNHTYSDGLEPSCKPCRGVADATRRQRLLEAKGNSLQQVESAPPVWPAGCLVSRMLHHFLH